MNRTVITTNSYHLIGYGNELFYDEIEINLCGGLNSGFERNLFGLCDVFSGKFGILQNASKNNIFHIHILKSKLLDQRVRQLMKECNDQNKFIKIFFY